MVGDGPKIEITIRRIGDLFFTNATLVTGEPLEDFVCTTGQSSMFMSLASAMPFIQDYAQKLPSESQTQEPQRPSLDTYLDSVAMDALVHETMSESQNPIGVGICESCGKTRVLGEGGMCHSCSSRPWIPETCYVCGGSKLVTGTKPDGSEDHINLDPCFQCTPEGRARSAERIP